MDKEHLIKQWLNNSLTEAEREAFENLEDYGELMKIQQSLQGFSAPVLDTDKALSETLEKLKKPSKKLPAYQFLLRVAAVLVIGLGLFFLTKPQTVNMDTLSAETENAILPDQSEITLNALSTVSYPKNFDKNRSLDLEGEAFFKVAKGSQFRVETASGAVMVYGTQFNVKQRDGYFEVSCYEGLVGVTYNGKETKLHPNETFLLLNHTATKTKTSNKTPSWLKGKSSFDSLPLKLVLEELERQYGISVKAKTNVDTSQLFSGFFPNDDLESALKTVLLPFELHYEQNQKTITVY